MLDIIGAYPTVVIETKDHQTPSHVPCTNDVGKCWLFDFASWKEIAGKECCWWKALSENLPKPIWYEGHFGVAFWLCVKTNLHAKPFKRKSARRAGAIPFSCKSNFFPYKRFGTKTRFETEAQGHSVKAYWQSKESVKTRKRKNILDRKLFAHDLPKNKNRKIKKKKIHSSHQ